MLIDRGGREHEVCILTGCESMSLSVACVSDCP